MQQAHRPVPPPQQIPLLGQQRQPTPQQQVAIVQETMRQLSLGIFANAAVERLADGPADPDSLRQLARDSQTAARAYFEGIGAIEIDERSDSQETQPKG